MLIRNTLLCALTAALGMTLVEHTTAQTFTTLYSFTNGNDGANPYGGLVLSTNTLYGTTWQGGPLANGTVFSVNTNGSAFTVLHAFTGGNDGSSPYADLTLSGNTLYGTAVAGGADGNGTVFKLTTTGGGFTVLHSFTDSDGALPYGGLVLSGNILYGTAWQGGGASAGIVFAVTTNGTGFRIVHNFTAEGDGQDIQAGVTLAGNTLYGTAVFGGAFDNGTVFAVNTNDSAFTNVYSFTLLSHATNGDGAFPYAAVVASSNILYGTAWGGGIAGNGTVFAVNTNGTGFTTLHTFTATSGSPASNGDGTFPMAALMLSNNVLYGTTSDGGSAGNGTVFAVNTDGTEFTVLHSFTALDSIAATNSDGSTPQSSLILSGNTLFGTAWNGGGSGFGTVFSLTTQPTIAPHLTVTAAGTNIVLTWPAGAAGFALQSTASLTPPVNWAAASPTPVLVNGQNTVTNIISGAQMFYRLSQ